MSDFFLKIDPEKLTLPNLKHHQLPIPETLNADFCDIIFYSKDEYCDYLKEIEKASMDILSQYWILKSQDLIDKSKYIIKVLTILHASHAEYYPS